MKLIRASDHFDLYIYIFTVCMAEDDCKMLCVSFGECIIGLGW